jgi:PadR family transcriptional regulator PadR
MRKTRPQLKVISEFMKDPTERQWGYELSRRSGVRSAVLYRILERMLEQGLLDDGWEDPAHITEKRPPRRYYRLTAAGQAEFASMLDAARSDARFEFLAERFA